MLTPPLLLLLRFFLRLLTEGSQVGEGVGGDCGITPWTLIPKMIKHLYILLQPRKTIIKHLYYTIKSMISKPCTQLQWAPLNLIRGIIPCMLTLDGFLIIACSKHQVCIIYGKGRQYLLCHMCINLCFYNVTTKFCVNISNSLVNTCTTNTSISNSLIMEIKEVNHH